MGIDARLKDVIAVKIWIIEDEKPAAARLAGMIREIEPRVEIDAVLHSVDASIRQLREHPHPELLFMDIELTDGLSFEIFSQIPVPCPVIFTTAYDDYWQQAFANHGLDYLLKPVKKDQLEQAFQKYRTFQRHFLGRLTQFFHSHKPAGTETPFRKRMLIKRGNEYVPVPVEDIAYFMAEQKLVCLVTREGKKYVVDQSISDLEKELDPEHFFRLNRKFLSHRQAIQRIKGWGKGKLQVELEPKPAEDASVSQEMAAKFKDWLNT